MSEQIALPAEVEPLLSAPPPPLALAQAPTLPQHDADAKGRAAGLAEMQKQYGWDHAYLRPLAMLHEQGTDNPSLRAAIRAALGFLPKGFLEDAANRMFGSPILPRPDAPEFAYITERFRAQYRIDQNKRYIAALAAKSSVANADEFRRLFVTLEAPTGMQS